ncbi:uncharacterized protein MELLADRAFT_40738 [Melampsora larici-populina 98AG31]|uniref:Fe2OG dioxygenase domain-containing protein n=1 Tax=Melampsora larici-populina (strain 98AG31 / pathotype 3-4-7) TaxID=747676 RepID=F4S9K7_MELLP|nr:uncharacterized protein MELLADRAFT_40738 [Melampsora larici-populina 98AG31]EGF98655.1 hypothetical protein MELLADRAFT_40738 [Melampsora larici-populina 98AG31]
MNPNKIIDFSTFHNPSTSIQSKIKLSNQINHQLNNFGYLYLTEIPIQNQTIQDAFQWSQKFFNLPLEIKQKVSHPIDGSINRGYSAIGIEKVVQNDLKNPISIKSNRSKPDDQRETFDLGKFNFQSNPSLQNLWLPDPIEKDYHLNGMQDFFKKFYQECYEFEHQLLEAISISLLGIEHQDYLSNFHIQADNQIRLSHYPSIIKNDHNLSINRFSPHTDFSTFTILFQDQQSGLEIEDQFKPNQFNPIPSIPNTVILHVGDLLMRWTNDHFKSPLHRVSLPLSETNLIPERYLISFFCGPDRGTLIDCLETCFHPTHDPKKYGPITAEAYIDMRLKLSY